MAEFNKIIQPYRFAVGAAIALFILNNILLGTVVPRMPGGSASGITTMFVVTLVSLFTRRIESTPLVYLAYGLIGLPSHIAHGDWAYFTILLSLLIPATVFSLILHRLHYRPLAYFAAFPVHRLLIQGISSGLMYFFYGQNPIAHMDALTFALSFLSGYGGITAAVICFSLLSRRQRDLPS